MTRIYGNLNFEQSLALSLKPTLEQAIAANFLVISVESCLSDAVQLLHQSRQSWSDLEQWGKDPKSVKSCYSCILVVAESRLVGILTQSDLLSLLVSESDPKLTQVADVMTQPVVTIARSQLQEIATPLDLLRLLRENHCSHLPILDEDAHPIGVITLKELVQIIDFEAESSCTLQLQHLNQNLEQQIQERTNALVNSDNHLNLIVSHISDGILIVDQEGRIVFANPSAANTFGMPVEELVGLLIGVPNVLDNQFEITHFSQDGKIGESELSVVSIEWDCEPAYLISLHDITERQQAEARLLKIQTDLAEAQKIAHVGSWEFDLNTRKIAWSDEMYRLFGLVPDQGDLTYEQMMSYISERDWEVFHTLIDRAIHFGESYKLDLQIIKTDGSIGYLFTRGTPTYNHEGHICGLFGTAIDISDRKARESMLRRYERVVAATTDAIILYSHDYRYQLVNQVYLDWHGKQQMEVIGRMVVELSGEEIFERMIRPSLDRCLAGEVQRYEGWFDYQDGCRRFVRVTYSPYIEIDGSITGVLASLHDLTELKQTEEYLRASEERLRRYFDQPLLGMAISNPDKSWQDVNSCLCDMLGYSHEEMLQKNWAEITHPDDLVANVDKFNQAIADEINGYVMDKRFICKNGEIIHTTISVQCLRNFDRSVNSFVLMVQDISDRKQTELQLQLTNEQLSRATRLKDEFLANMSHELRTPLNAILGMAETLQDQVFGDINEKQRKALQTIERSGDHLLALINDILDVAKIESGQVELEIALTDIDSLCQSSLAFIKQQSLKKHLQLEIKLPEYLPNQMLDERRIRQVLINLLNNAMKFTPEGGKIILEVSRKKQLLEQLEPIEQPNNPSKYWLHFAVTDTGIGIAPENIDRLFHPFTQIDSALNRQYAGTGLGLAIVRRIVELHGGRVGLRSNLGTGSCFSFDLPYTFDPSENMRDRHVIDSAKGNSALINLAPKPPLILIAEDNEANISTISSYLEARGYRLLLAKNGEEAIALATTHRPDLILMDVQMPIMDGLEAIRQIRIDPHLVDIPIIALTALTMAGDRDRCLAAGANEYLAKPVKLKQLTNSIRQFL